MEEHEQLQRSYRAEFKYTLSERFDERPKTTPPFPFLSAYRDQERMRIVIETTGDNGRPHA